MKLKSVLFAVFTASVLFAACGGNAAETTAKQAEKSVEAIRTDATAKAEFICPMKCEKDKVYDAAGKCPVCKMDLMAVAHKDGDGHDHGDEHKAGDGHDHSKPDSADKAHGYSQDKGH